MNRMTLIDIAVKPKSFHLSQASIIVSSAEQTV